MNAPTTSSTVLAVRAARQAWRAAAYEVGEHLLDCRQIPRCVAGGFRCPEGDARHQDADAAWDALEAARRGGNDR